MMSRKTLLLAGCISMPVAAVLAGDLSGNSGRYALSPVEGGMMRLDKESGAISLCTNKAGVWSCDAIEDRTKIVDDKIARLESENQQLKDRVKSLEDSLVSPPVKAPSPSKLDLPSEQDVDHAMDYMERIFKKLRDRIDRWEKEIPRKPQGADGSL